MLPPCLQLAYLEGSRLIAVKPRYYYDLRASERSHCWVRMWTVTETSQSRQVSEVLMLSHQQRWVAVSTQSTNLAPVVADLLICWRRCRRSTLRWEYDSHLHTQRTFRMRYSEIIYWTFNIYRRLCVCVGGRGWWERQRVCSCAWTGLIHPLAALPVSPSHSREFFWSHFLAAWCNTHSTHKKSQGVYLKGRPDTTSFRLHVCFTFHNLKYTNAASAPLY